MITILDEPHLNFVALQPRRDVERQAPRHRIITLAVQQTHRGGDANLAIEQQVGPRIIDEGTGIAIGFTIIGWAGEEALRLQLPPLGFAQLEPPNGEIRRRHHAHQPGQPILQRPARQQGDPAAHRASDQQHLARRPDMIDQRQHIIGPAADAAIKELAAAGPAARIIQPQKCLALGARPVAQRFGFRSGHVAHVTGQEYDERPHPRREAIGKAGAVMGKAAHAMPHKPSITPLPAGGLAILAVIGPGAIDRLAIIVLLDPDRLIAPHRSTAGRAQAVSHRLQIGPH